jgi:hypothetical protein
MNYIITVLKTPLLRGVLWRSHSGVCNYERQKELESDGVHSVRFLDSDSRDNIGVIIQCFEEWIDEFEKRNDL